MKIGNTKKSTHLRNVYCIRAKVSLIWNITNVMFWTAEKFKIAIFCKKKLAMTEKYQRVPFNTHGAHIAYLTPSPVMNTGSDDLFKLREGKLIKDLLL